ncbi:carbamoyltransferase HypF [Lutispora saccharofermentans]|uniref:Carbamoyltransferase HypF n=1 Tax=Lutispora saccharofermentans TaxID=3024236 RepID=A0ABT1NEB6_9FIRM|nr:carbamoyltransferase HypF [Lutispora saccharofermentans]MCQ1529600.1 carbamoyltransferase HypF [Lutispora saccharofermentans]
MMLSLKTNDGKEISCSNVLVKAGELLAGGNIVAVKGISGYHLACNARNEGAVQKLRDRKRRKDKPFALMAKDMETVKKECLVSCEEECLLQSCRMPIVLLHKKASCDLTGNIAPGMKRLGIMLPYTDIHASLFCDDLDLLIMTSGNISNSPIQYKDAGAIAHLSGIADYFLYHDNEIDIPLEDSVFKVFEGRESVIRGGRGFAPFKIHMGKGRYEVLALGSELKGAFSVLKDGYGYLSRCFGDLGNKEVFEIYQHALDRYLQDIGSQPSVIAYDMHPYYTTAQYASKLEGIKAAVQHHHAHMASCMAEHSLHRKTIGIIYDGTGWGTDGAIWGGEFFIGSREAFHRAGHFKYVSLQGGDQSVKEPWRTALSYLHSIGYAEKRNISQWNKEKSAVVEQALKTGYNCYASSSLGRLFDCAASLLGICQRINYDAQAAILLESILNPYEKAGYEYKIYENNGGRLEIDYKGIIEGIMRDMDNNIAIGTISSRFHNTICDITLDMALKIRKISNVETVVLSGGCFENTYLLKGVLERLRGEGFDVYYNQHIPINDNGISIGQLAAASALYNREVP